MKQTKLKRKSKNPRKKLIDEADRLLQDYYRALYPNKKCEVCGGETFYFMHHFIEKSKSNNLRFNHLNLIFICKKCHSLHHCFGDATIHAKIQSKRGEDWWNELKKENEIHRTAYSIKELR